MPLNYVNPVTGSPVATDVVSGNNYQIMKLDTGGLGLSVPWTGAVTVTSGTIAVTGTVAVTGSFFPATQPISAVSLPALSGTTAVSIAGNQAVNNVQFGGVAVNMGTGQVATGTQRVALGVGTPAITVVNSSITTGGTAQTAIAANAGRLACMIQNTHATALITINEGGTASATAGILLNPGVGYEYPVGSMPVGAISIFSATTGATYTVRHA